MAERAPTIALIASSYHPHIGGVEQHTAQVAAGLLARGRRVEVWTVARDGIAGLREVDGVTVRDLPTPLPRMSPSGVASFVGRFPLALRHWMGAYRSLRPDVLHVQCFGPNGIYAQIVSALTRKPLVVSSHGETYMDDHNIFDRSVVFQRGLGRAIDVADAVTACAPGVARDLAERFGASDVSVVPNGVRVAGLPGSREPRPHRTRLLAAGRVENNKGFDLLLRAMPSLPADVELTVIGDGSQREPLAQLSMELGVADRVHFAGRRSPAEVLNAMGEADVVVVPSRTEPFGIVVLEAWAAGTPVVTTALSGPADFVSHGADGLLVDPRDTAALAGAIQDLLSDDDLWSRLSAGGWQTVQRYTWDAVVADYERIYDQLELQRVR